jgi:hypothetical protein
VDHLEFKVLHLLGNCLGRGQGVLLTRLGFLQRRFVKVREGGETRVPRHLHLEKGTNYLFNRHLGILLFPFPLTPAQ